MKPAVAMLTPFYDPVPGGLTSFVRGLSRALREVGATVTIVAREGAETDGVRVVPGDAATYVKGATRLLRDSVPDVIHAHGHWYTLAAALRVRGDNTRPRVIFTFHTPWGTLARIRRGILLSLADCLTFPSAALRRAVVRRWHAGPEVRMAYPAVDVVSPPAARVKDFEETLGLPAESQVLAFVGPLQHPLKVKGVKDLIRAVALLRKEGCDVRLAIAGDGRYRAEVEVLAHRLAPGAVTVTGFILDPALLLARANLYTHISYLEGFPLAVLEAMSVGRCVIASPTGGIPDVITDGMDGVLVRGGPRKIAAVIARVLDDPDSAARMGKAAAAKVRKDFVWSRRAVEFLQIYGGS